GGARPRPCAGGARALAVRPDRPQRRVRLPGRRRARDAHARGGRARLPRGTDRPGHVCRGGPGTPDELGSQAVTTAAEVDRHAQTVRALSAPGAPLSRESPHATIANPAWFFTPGMPTPMREELHQQILGRLRATMENEVAHDKRAIVLAGPPGAGKSRILDELIGEPGSESRRRWLEVDPDEIKTQLLDAAAADGSYETFIKPPAVRELEAQGERFFPLDFAALVHEESSALAKIVREEAI